MSTSSESEILLIGLTGTGKTNFLVALDVILDNQNEPNGLVHSDHAADRAYLEPLRAQWLRGEHLEHTSRLAPPPPHQLLVVHPATGTRATFHVPDLAGETFDSHFINRSFPNEFGMRLQRATGILLFLHCKHQADHDLLEHPQFIENEPLAEEIPVDPRQVADWSIEQASRQAKLVDLLQFVSSIRREPLRIALTISAWDLVEKAAAAVLPKAPSPFLNKQWPLLAQFLQSNRTMFPTRVFGVSARGGGTSAQEIERLTSLVHPRERVTVVDGNHRSSDLTRPVRWLLELLDSPEEPNG